MHGVQSMKILAFISDRILLIFGNMLGMIALTIFLFALGNSAGDVVLIVITWTSVLCLYLGTQYIQRKRYFNQLDEALNGLERRYLIAELMEPSHRLEDKLYQEILHQSNKSVIEKINQLEEEQQDYKEYIESWIHEVKGPITTMNLICENSREINDETQWQEQTRKQQAELAKIENYVEMALFYARSEAVYKDYHIHELDLKPVVRDVITKNKHHLIQSKMQVHIGFETATVYSDEKWIAFIINQIILNAIKYKKNDKRMIEITVEPLPEALQLIITDHGIGIPESEVKRIFEKGFTGTNGRMPGKTSTGIGLYLCRKLCLKLDIGIKAESKEQEYTKIILTFPVSSYLTKM